MELIYINVYYVINIYIMSNLWQLTAHWDNWILFQRQIDLDIDR